MIDQHEGNDAMRRDEIEAEVNAALCEAIKDRANAMLAAGSTISEVIMWARANNAGFARIHAATIAAALSGDVRSGCHCQRRTA